MRREEEGRTGEDRGPGKRESPSSTPFLSPSVGLLTPSLITLQHLGKEIRLRRQPPQSPYRPIHRSHPRPRLLPRLSRRIHPRRHRLLLQPHRLPFPLEPEPLPSRRSPRWCTRRSRTRRLRRRRGIRPTRIRSRDGSSTKDVQVDQFPWWEGRCCCWFRARRLRCRGTRRRSSRSGGAEEEVGGELRGDAPVLDRQAEAEGEGGEHGAGCGRGAETEEDRVRLNERLRTC